MEAAQNKTKQFLFMQKVVKWFIVYQLEIQSRDLSTGYTVRVSVF